MLKQLYANTDDTSQMYELFGKLMVVVTYRSDITSLNITKLSGHNLSPNFWSVKHLLTLITTKCFVHILSIVLLITIVMTLYYEVFSDVFHDVSVIRTADNAPCGR